MTRNGGHYLWPPAPASSPVTAQPPRRMPPEPRRSAIVFVRNGARIAMKAICVDRTFKTIAVRSTRSFRVASEVENSTQRRKHTNDARNSNTRNWRQPTTGRLPGCAPQSPSQEAVQPAADRDPAASQAASRAANQHPRSRVARSRVARSRAERRAQKNVSENVKPLSWPIRSWLNSWS